MKKYFFEAAKKQWEKPTEPKQYLCATAKVTVIAENLRKAGLNTVLGMGTTFVILIFLSLIISLFKFIPDLQDGFAKKKTAAASPAAQAVDNTISQIIEKEEAADDNELIAVITAAIAAYEGASGSAGTVSPSGDGFVVRSIRRRF